MMENKEYEWGQLDCGDYKRVPKGYHGSKRVEILGKEAKEEYTDSFHLQKQQQQQQQQQDQSYGLQKQHLQKSSKISNQSMHRHHPYGPKKNESIQWSESLSNLLRSSEGSKLFMQFLKVESSDHAKMLQFWFAVEGFRFQSNKNLYIETFLDHFTPLPIDEEKKNELLKQIARINKYGENDERLKFIFDDIQLEVEEIIKTSTYPKFLLSELYFNYGQDFKSIKKQDTEMYSDTDESPVDYSKRYASNENCHMETDKDRVVTGAEIIENHENYEQRFNKNAVSMDLHDEKPVVEHQSKQEGSHYRTNDVKVEPPYEEMVVEDEKITINRNTNLNDSVNKQELNMIIQKSTAIRRPKVAQGFNVSAPFNVAQDSVLFKLEEVSKRLTEFGQVQNILDDHVDRYIPDPPKYTHTRTSTNKIPMQAMSRLNLDSDNKTLHKSRQQQMSRSVSSTCVSNKKPSSHRQQRYDAGYNQSVYQNQSVRYNQSVGQNQSLCCNQSHYCNAESSSPKLSRPTEPQEGNKSSKLFKGTRLTKPLCCHPDEIIGVHQCNI